MKLWNSLGQGKVIKGDTIGSGRWFEDHVASQQ
jgi:hypothetical protein